MFAVSCAPVTGDNDDDPGGVRITKFVIDGVDGVIDQTEKTIEVILPPKTNLTALISEVEFVGTSIAPAIGESVDFTAVEPVGYTLLSKDGSATYYKVKVFAGNPDDNKIVSFELDGVTAVSVSITEPGDASGAISVKVPYGTVLSNLTAKISYNGDLISPLEGSVRDFSQTLTYDVYSRQGDKRTYSVTVTTATNTDASLSVLTLNGATLSPAFSKGTYTYDVTAATDTIRVTAAANDANAKLVYVENNNAAITSGTAFITKTLSETAGTLVTVKVTAENGTDTKSYTLNVTYVKFALVPGGSFRMGSESGDGDEKPVHTVTLNKFSIAKCQVTQKEYKELTGNSPNYKGDYFPVENVSWFDAVEYCNKLSDKENLTKAYTISGSGDNRTVTWNKSANGYRLPTEAEWEYAARGGNDSPGDYTYAGSNTVNDVAWYSGNGGGKTHDIGGKDPNGLGLYDMSGNVYEWCWDRYGGYNGADQTNPEGASSGSGRVVRGGSFTHAPTFVRSACRYNFSPSKQDGNLGFRVVRP